MEALRKRRRTWKVLAASSPASLSFEKALPACRHQPKLQCRQFLLLFGRRSTKRGVAGWQKGGSQLWTRAETCAKAGCYAAALRGIEQTVAICQDTAERWAPRCCALKARWRRSADTASAPARDSHKRRRPQHRTAIKSTISTQGPRPAWLRRMATMMRPAITRSVAAPASAQPRSPLGRARPVGSRR